MKLFQMFANGKPYGQVIIAGKLKDLQQDYIIPDKAFYSSSKITCKQVGVMVYLNGMWKAIRFDDSEKFNQDLKSLTNLQLKALIEKDFTNDNTSFYLLEKGMLQQDRETLSERGEEFLKRIETNSTIDLN